MPAYRIRPTPRRGHWLRAALLATVVAPLTGCLYGFSAGGGLGGEISTIAIVPVLNDSDRFDVADEIYAALQRELPGRLGLRVGAEESADAIVRALLSSYSLSAPNYRSTGAGAGGVGGGAQVLQRQVSLRVHVQLIDRAENLVLWEERSLSVTGTYPEDGGAEEDGRGEAIELLIQRIVDGAQSQW